MAANVITLGRILLTFFVIVLFQWGFYFRVSAIVLTIIVIYLDSLDGIIARKLGLASEFGALFDITGDRIVEHIYLIFFASMGIVSFWVPIIFVCRSFLVDTLRSVAFAKEGKTPFGEKSMMRSSLTLFLTASRFSRAVYGFGKVLIFVLLGAILALQKRPDLLSPDTFGQFNLVTQTIVWIVVAMNLIRGLPVLWDGHAYLFDKEFPRALKDAG